MITSILLLLFILLEQTPFPASINIAMPAFSLCLIFYCSMKNSKPPYIWALFIIGIIKDSIAGLPLGITSILWILFVMLLVNLKKKIPENSPMVFYWIMFLLASFVYWFVEWMILSSYYQQILPLPVKLQLWVLSGLIYVPLHIMFNKINRSHA